MDAFATWNIIAISTTAILFAAAVTLVVRLARRHGRRG